jgi:carboxypeptidase family protein/dockerin type I repeat protein
LSIIPTLPVVEVPLIPETPTPLPQEPLALPTIPPLIGSVSGFTGYQNRSSQNGIIVQLYSGQTPLAQLVTNADGGFQFTDVPDGSYTIALSAPGHLPVVTTVDVVGGQPVSLGTLQLQSGDADDNGSIDLSDAALIGANFQLAVPPAPPSADLNGDGQINIADLAMLGSNYGSMSPLTLP